MPLEVLRGWASGTESAVDSRRQVGSERVCVKLSCCLDVPYSLVGWWERVVVGLGRELGLLLCCEFLGCLTSLQSSPPPLFSHFLATQALSLSDRVLGEPWPPPCCPWDACAPPSPSRVTKPQAAADRGMPARVHGWTAHLSVPVQISG